VIAGCTSGCVRSRVAKAHARTAPRIYMPPLARSRAARYLRRTMTNEGHHVTELLHRWAGGDDAALERLLPSVYADLRRIAASTLRSTPGHATLQTTALVHEVVLRLLGRAPADFASTSHLLNASARMMRQVLVDRARRMQTTKRGGAWLRDDFAEALELPIPDGTDLAALDAALDDLANAHERMAKVIELRYFMGLDVADVARALDITPRTAQRDWIAARAWLRERLDA
jgi:RNA polymerase sigma factor (TIGR02999 family)